MCRQFFHCFGMMAGQWVLSPFDLSDKSAKWPRAPNSECLLQENTIPTPECLSLSSKKAHWSLSLQSPDSKVFLGTQDCSVTSDPLLFPPARGQYMSEWDRAVMDLLGQRRKSVIGCGPSWSSCSAAVMLTWNIKVPLPPHPRPVHQLCQFYLKSAFPRVNHADILGPDVHPRAI